MPRSEAAKEGCHHVRTAAKILSKVRAHKRLAYPRCRWVFKNDCDGTVSLYMLLILNYHDMLEIMKIFRY